MTRKKSEGGDGNSLLSEHIPIHIKLLGTGKEINGKHFLKKKKMTVDEYIFELLNYMIL